MEQNWDERIAAADPTWYPQVLRTLARDYPEISDKVWTKAVVENAVERIKNLG